MRTLDYSPGGGGRGWFPDTPRRPDDDDKDSRIAWENRPSAVFGELAVVLGVTVGFVILINLILRAFGIG